MSLVCQNVGRGSLTVQLSLGEDPVWDMASLAEESSLPHSVSKWHAQFSAGPFGMSFICGVDPFITQSLKMQKNGVK